MAHKLSLTNVANVFQWFMTFHLHCFHFSSSTLSAHFRYDEAILTQVQDTFKKKKQHQDLLFLMTSVQKILCALHADLLRSDTNYP